VLPGLVALIQASETLKLLLGIGDSLCGRLLQIDALGMEFREFRIQKDPKCPACGEQPTLTQLIDYEGFCGMPSENKPGLALRETTVKELEAARARGDELLLLDVREPSEHARAKIDGAKLVPLGQLEGRVHELDAWRGKRIVIHCHHGGRSARACALLREQGFERVENLAGGIDAWSQSVDPSVPRY
jgi:adenylyltransferase/sulfurtransferase